MINSYFRLVKQVKPFKIFLENMFRQSKKMYCEYYFNHVLATEITAPDTGEFMKSVQLFVTLYTLSIYPSAH